jgi:glycosyltransferase involved in cell wall biosynthesis
VSRVRRAINETLLSRAAWKALRTHLKNHSHDLIVYYSPSIFWGPLVRKLKKLWACPSYLILRDIFPQWAIDSGILSENSPVTKFFRYFEQVNYRAANVIALQSAGDLQRFQKYCPEGAQLDLLYNWAADVSATSIGNTYRDKLGLHDKVVYFYGGNIGHAQNMLNLVCLAKNMRSEEKAHFVFAGTGDEVDLVQHEIEREGLDNLTLLPPVPQEDYHAMLNEFDVGLFSLHPSHTTNNFPGKLLGYMQAQKPILGSINKNNDLKSVVENADAGLITVNGDDQGLLANALAFLRNETLRKQTGICARQLLESTFSVKGAADHILSMYLPPTSNPN